GWVGEGVQIVLRAGEDRRSLGVHACFLCDGSGLTVPAPTWGKQASEKTPLLLIPLLPGVEPGPISGSEICSSPTGIESSDESPGRRFPIRRHSLYRGPHCASSAASCVAGTRIVRGTRPGEGACSEEWGGVDPSGLGCGVNQ